MKTLIEKLRALAETEKKATPGPWIQNPGPDTDNIDHKRANQLYVRLGKGSANVVVERKAVFGKATVEDVANGAVIADSRTLLKELLESWFAQREALEQATLEMEFHDSGQKQLFGEHIEAARKALKLATTTHP